MLRNKRILVFIFCILCLSIGAYVFISSYGVRVLYENSVDEVPYESIEFEKDTNKTNTDSAYTNHSEYITDTLIGKADESVHTLFSSGPDSYKAVRNNNAANTPFKNDPVKSFATQVDATHTIIKKEDLPKGGTAILADRFHINYTLNTRWRLTNFYNSFEEGDYMTGAELSKLYKKDPSINKIVKNTICSFIENNIDRITRVKNALVIHTLDVNGIHSKIKIPFIEDMRIDIANGSAIYIGQTFLSNEPLFQKSYLLPVTIKDINIMHNGEPFPKNGFISGDYYFIDYAQTKTAYKIK
ncbi:MAG: hypothetical protein H7259_07055 [Cytophagales bacterium]|nr:hypothetical protein [Cytophaga sp.]